VDSKMLTVRLPAEQAQELEAVAQADGVPVAEEVRTAIAAHIEARRNDQAFRERLRASIERNKKILEKLAES
jgi:predicted DNA-binding protein